MPSEQIRFLLETIGSIAGIAALVAIALEFLRARRADARDFLFHIYEKYEGLAKEMVLVESKKPMNKQELLTLARDAEEFDDAFQKIFNFWEEFTTMLAVSYARFSIGVEAQKTSPPKFS